MNINLIACITCLAIAGLLTLGIISGYFNVEVEIIEKCTNQMIWDRMC